MPLIGSAIRRITLFRLFHCVTRANVAGCVSCVLVGRVQLGGELSASRPSSPFPKHDSVTWYFSQRDSVTWDLFFLLEEELNPVSHVLLHSSSSYSCSDVMKQNAIACYLYLRRKKLIKVTENVLIE